MSTQRPSTDELLDELSALYREVDALYALWSCPGTTECCRFGITGRQPYVTSIEIAAIEHAIGRRGGPLRPNKRALPLHTDAAQERACGLLDRNGRCSIYADRPLGCRTHYCERAAPGPGPSREVLRDLVRRLQELATRHEMGGDAARPLERVLDE